MPLDEFDWATAKDLPHWALDRGGEPLIQGFQDATPVVTSDQFDQFCDYITVKLLPLINSILRTAVQVLGFPDAQKWVRAIQASWVKCSESNPAARTRQMWLTRAIDQFVNAKAETDAYYTRTKLEIQMEGYAAIRAKFMDFFFPLLDRITYQINEAVRYRLFDRDELPLADGLIAVINFTHREIDLGSRVGGPGRLTFIPMGASMSLANGISYSSVTCYYRLYALLAHEAAHSVFMKHWIGGDGPEFPSHDHAERNCVMQYPLLMLPRATSTVDGVIDAESKILLDEAKADYTRHVFDAGVAGNGGKFNIWTDHVLPRFFSPHFCGKCNLQLRGWNVLAQRGGVQVLPKSSADPNPANDAYDVKDDPVIKPPDAAAAGAAGPAARKPASALKMAVKPKETPLDVYNRQRREFFAEVINHGRIIEACSFFADPGVDGAVRNVLTGAATYYHQVFAGDGVTRGLLTREPPNMRISPPYRKSAPPASPPSPAPSAAASPAAASSAPPPSPPASSAPPPSPPGSSAPTPPASTPPASTPPAPPPSAPGSSAPPGDE